MMVTQASKTRVFTATWPSYAPATGRADGTRGGSKGHVGQQTGPFCQVAIQAVPASPDGYDTFTSGTAANAAGNNGRNKKLVYLERSLPLRSYNSISLSEDGTYSVTLSDCHGIVPSASPSLAGTTQPLLSSSINGDRRLPEGARRQNVEENGGRSCGSDDDDIINGPTVEAVRVLFVPLPLSIEFRVETGQVAGGETAVGNFHLLPVSHVPQVPQPSLCGMDSKCEGTSVRNHDHDQELGVRHALQSSPPPGEGGDRDGSSPSSARGCGDDRSSLYFSPGSCFVSGVATGVLFYFLLTWLVVTRGYGKRSWERGVNRLKVESGWVETAIGDQGARKKRGLHVIEDGEQSDNGSSDSDTILDGNVPEPVGLPRSDEDWRALFDTLYEDRANIEAADARLEASCTSAASDGVKVDAAVNSVAPAATGDAPPSCST
ncbi:unnamed protein product [Pylaiella littoralis]